MLPRPVVRRFVFARMLSGRASDAPKFDPEMVKAYNQMSANHEHVDGPWLAMRDIVAKHAGEGNPVKILLDLASGPGQPAMALAEALPSAEVISSDVSEDMVEAASAKAQAQGLRNLKAVVADAQNLSEYAEGSVDVVTCCYGYMFPSDKGLALRETHRVLRPGGLLVATTWDRVDILKISRDVMEAVLGVPPPPPPLNPMSLSEPGLFRKLVEDAGFLSVEQTTSTYPFNFGSDKSFQLKVGTLLLKDKIDEFGPDGWAKAEAAFWTNIGKYTTVEAGSGDMIMPQNTFRLTVARKEK